MTARAGFKTVLPTFIMKAADRTLLGNEGSAPVVF